ncbi:MAG: Glycosyl transferase family 39 [Candidatus Woesebacteria bacterium]|nr:MAG: Glycosyl transferase family 39 [Candidatus Woesebacteria bacterium]
MSKAQKLSLFAIFVLAFVLRFWKLGDISFHFHADESSIAYNAYSLIKTGRDMYGQTFPILFRANGSYQPPVYTYLTTIPVFLFGNTIFAARFVSAFSGVLLVILSFYFWKFFGLGKKEEKILQGVFAALFVAISPWSVHFGRLTAEGNLVVLVFGLGVFFTLLSLEKSRRQTLFFVLGCLFLGLSTHTYYTERVTAFLYIFFFIILSRNYFKANKKALLYGFFVFLLFILPHLYIAKTGALTRRLAQVGYFSDPAFVNSDFSGKVLFAFKNFAGHYLDYFSPKNLFFNSGNELGRVGPDLSVFYPLFLFLAVLGLRGFINNIDRNIVKVFSFLILISPVPAGLTGDIFFPIRVLVFLWLITNIISYGFYMVFKFIKNGLFRLLVFSLLLIYSLFILYTSRFVLFKYRIVNSEGSFPYLKLLKQIDKYRENKIYIDRTDRAWGIGTVSAYILGADPYLMQNNLKSQLITPYYSGEVNPYEIFVIDNIIIKPIEWGEICGKDLLLVGDRFSVSQDQMKSHFLTKVFEIEDLRGEAYLFGYNTNKPCSER